MIACKVSKTAKATGDQVGGKCGGEAPLASWLQRRRNPSYICSALLYAYAHALRLLSRGVIPRAAIGPNLHLGRLIRMGDPDAVTAWEVYHQHVSARWHCCPDLTDMTLTAGLIHARLRDENGYVISYRRARKLVALLEWTKTLIAVGVTETSRWHEAKLYVQPQPPSVELPVPSRGAVPAVAEPSDVEPLRVKPSSADSHNPQFLSVRTEAFVSVLTSEIHLLHLVPKRNTGPPAIRKRDGVKATKTPVSLRLRSFVLGDGPTLGSGAAW